MAIYQLTRTSTPLNAPAPGSLLPGQLAVEMATQPNPRLWVGVPTTIDATGRRLLVSTSGGGGGGIPDAPTDGQTYGRDGETETWVPVMPLSGGQMRGELQLNNTAMNLMDAVPLSQIGSFLGFTVSATAPPSPTQGVLWFNTAAGVLNFWNGTAWQPTTGFLSLSGGTMNGNLILDGPPSNASNPNQAATVGYVDSLLMGAVQFIGTMNASTGVVTYTESSGISGTSLIPPAQAKDDYVIVAESGTIPTGFLAGTVCNVGDWIISDGTEWFQIAVSGEEVLAANVAVSPTILGQGNVQAALSSLLTNFGLYAPLSSPNFSGIPTVPTAAIGDSSTTIANTSWVNAQGFISQILLTGDVNGSPSTNLDAVVMAGDITGAVSIAGSGDFLDQLTLQGDTGGASTSTLPDYVTIVQLTSPDATSTQIAG
jgi:hypothetical protein